MKKVIRTILFILIFLIIYSIIFNKLGIEETPISRFYKEHKNTIDIIYLGNSGAYRFFNSNLAFDKYGYTVYPFSSDEAPLESFKIMLNEIKKYQSPKLYIIDITQVGEEANNKEGSIRKIIDNLKFSKNKIDAINKLVPSNISKTKYISYYFNFLLYHNNWKNYNYIYDPTNYFYKGYFYVWWNTRIKKFDKYIWINDKEKIPDDLENTFLHLIKYIENNKLNVLFIVPPKIYNIEENKKINTAIEILENKNYKVINFNTLKDISFDYNTEFHDKLHLNTQGSTKFTLYLSKYLKNNYNLPNHKNDKLYKSWYTEYERFKKDYKKYTNKDFLELVKKYEKEGY